MRSVLIVEPYEGLARLLSLALEDLGYTPVLADCRQVNDEELVPTNYACAFVNLDQGSAAWSEEGSRLARVAYRQGLSVVVIPDDTAARDQARDEGWIHISKPFTAEVLARALDRAMIGKRGVRPGDEERDAGRASGD